jgi:hypothetical protein
MSRYQVAIETVVAQAIGLGLSVLALVTLPVTLWYERRQRGG